MQIVLPSVLILVLLQVQCSKNSRNAILPVSDTADSGRNQQGNFDPQDFNPLPSEPLIEDVADTDTSTDLPEKSVDGPLVKEDDKTAENVTPTVPVPTGPLIENLDKAIGALTLWEHQGSNGQPSGRKWRLDFDQTHDVGPIYDLVTAQLESFDNIATAYMAEMRAGYQVRIFEDFGGGGRSYVVDATETPQVKNFDWMNDKASSFRLERVGAMLGIGSVTLWDRHQAGVSVVLDFDRGFRIDRIYPLLSVRYPDDIASVYQVKLHSDFQLRLFEHRDGSGKSYVLRGNSDSLVSLGSFDNIASAFRLERVSTPVDVGSLTLWDKDGSGSSIHLDFNASSVMQGNIVNLRDVGYADDIASFVRSSLNPVYQVRLYEHRDGQGRSWVVVGNSPTLFHFGWFDNLASSFRLELRE